MRFETENKIDLLTDIKEGVPDDSIMMYDELSGRFFRCNPKGIRKACDDLNSKLNFVNGCLEVTN